jgi:regulator of sirC expression with transglutaminase-like and TPR domain
MKTKRFKALFNLLDDPNDEIYKEVSQQIISQGMEIIPILEKNWENSTDELKQSRIEGIIHHIQFTSTQEYLSKWMNSGAKDLIEGAYLVAKHQFCNLEMEEIMHSINMINRDIWLELHKNLTALEKVKIINRIIFNVHGYTPVTEKAHLPHYTYINRVLETKKGNDISLGILYLTVAQKLGIPIYGVNLPNNFVLAYIDSLNYGELFRDNILFYIDPLNNGMVLSREEIDHYLQKLDIPTNASFYLPCDNKKVIQRLISSLIFSYDKLNHADKMEQLRELFSIVGNK